MSDVDFHKFDLSEHLRRQQRFSHRVFGPGGLERTYGVLKHLRKELNEVQKAPHDLMEWVDVMILAFDGAMRAGHHPHQITEALFAKQVINEHREWPDWWLHLGKPIEHVRS